jgi:hypothetical protein
MARANIELFNKVGGKSPLQPNRAFGRDLLHGILDVGASGAW